MGLREIFAAPDIDLGVNKCRMTPKAILLDVRPKIEYDAGHVPGSRGVPLADIARVERMIRDKDTPIFVYCHKGADAHKAIKKMRKMGFTNLENIGGFKFYNGRVER